MTIKNPCVVYDPKMKPPASCDALILMWDNTWQVNSLEVAIAGLVNVKVIIHSLNGLASVWLPRILNNPNIKANHLFYLSNDTKFTREERFEISTFLGEQSLSKVNPNRHLRELYKFWSYQVILHENDLSDEQWSLLQAEKKLNPSPIFPESEKAWVLAIKDLLSNGEAKEVDLPPLKSGESIPLILMKNLVKRFIKPGTKRGGKSTSMVYNSSFREVEKPDPRTWRKVFITGWYGTETAGDKAILGEIIHRLRFYNPNVEIYVSSIDLRVSWQTRIEMNLDVKHILIQEMQTALEDPELDAVLMGGGPLMESSQILPIAKFFHGAALKGINRVIFGCGVGPIHTDPMSEHIAHIIRVSNVAFYRDQESLDYALRLGADPKNSILACDPATAFINRWRQANPKKAISKKISTMLREQTAEYDTKADIDSQNLVFPSRIAEVLVDLKKNSSSLEELNLIPMHVYWRGNDDRLLNHKIASQVADHLSISPYLGYKGIYELIDSLNQSKLAIAMRYHGHIFSIALNIPFISLDYTGKKGKVSNLMQRLGLSDYSVKFEDFTPSVLKPKLDQIEANPGLEADLKTKTKELTATLEKAYQFFWD